MRRRMVLLTGGVAALVAALVTGGTAVSEAAVTVQGPVAGGAPYIYPATAGRDPVPVMQQTGVRAFTLAFILARTRTECTPTWEGQPLTSAAHRNRINAIRGAGGDVVVSFGGWSGNKLGNACANPTALAGAYQQVIDAYRLKVIDIDLEAGEVSQSRKVLQALQITKRRNPAVQTIMTLGTGQRGLEGDEAGIPGQAVALGAPNPVDVWTIMPFNFGGNGKDMGQLSVQASEGLHQQLKTAYRTMTDAQIYAMQGISSMNNRTDVGENVTVAHFRTMLRYCTDKRLARFTFWELNRDPTLAFTKVIGEFRG